MAFFVGLVWGFEPIYIQLSGGQLLPPLQTLVTTSIYPFLSGKDKCKSNPSSSYSQKYKRTILGRIHVHPDASEWMWTDVHNRLQEQWKEWIDRVLKNIYNSLVQLTQLICSY